MVRSDAYRALQRSTSLYDVIVSEPSNPWVTGVELLYSLEFLKAAAHEGVDLSADMLRQGYERHYHHGAPFDAPLP